MTDEELYIHRILQWHREIAVDHIATQFNMTSVMGRLFVPYEQLWYRRDRDGTNYYLQSSKKVSTAGLNYICIIALMWRMQFHIQNYLIPTVEDTIPERIADNYVHICDKLDKICEELGYPLINKEKLDIAVFDLSTEGEDIINTLRVKYLPYEYIRFLDRYEDGNENNIYLRIRPVMRDCKTDNIPSLWLATREVENKCHIVDSRITSEGLVKFARKLAEG